MITNRAVLTWTNIDNLAVNLFRKIRNMFPNARFVPIYPIYSGGIAAAQAVLAESRSIDHAHDPKEIVLVSDPEAAELFIDDLIPEDGGLAKEFEVRHGKPSVALIDKRNGTDICKESYFVFPWKNYKEDNFPKHYVRQLLKFIGDDPNRNGLRDTPDRVVRSYKEMFAGYKEDPLDYMKVFDGFNYDEVVLMKDISFTSLCEHHMLPFYGTAHVAYLPGGNGKVIGASKLIRILEVFTKRLQVQERICEQVAEALMKGLDPKGAACIIEARHGCIACRGVKNQEAVFVTSYLVGVFRTSATARQELLALIGKETK